MCVHLIKNNPWWFIKSLLIFAFYSIQETQDQTLRLGAFNAAKRTVRAFPPTINLYTLLPRTILQDISA